MGCLVNVELFWQGGAFGAALTTLVIASGWLCWFVKWR